MKRGWNSNAAKDTPSGEKVHFLVILVNGKLTIFQNVFQVKLKWKTLKLTIAHEKKKLFIYYSHPIFFYNSFLYAALH